MFRRTLSRSAVCFAFTLLLAFSLFTPAFAQSGRTRTATPPRTKANPEPTEQRTASPAQPAPATGPVIDTDETIKVEATLVSVPVVVSDIDGRYIPFLKKDRFRLYEDGVPQDISFFAPERVPFHVAIVLDVSGSTVLSIPDIQEAALAFVDQMREDDRICVITFSGSTNVLCDFTNDRMVLHDAIGRVRSGGSTKLYEAVYQTVREQMRGIEGRKAMILLTDGEDTSSRKVTYQQAIDAAMESDVLSYVVAYPPSNGRQINSPWGVPGSPPWPGGRGNPWPSPRRTPSTRWPWPLTHAFPPQAPQPSRVPRSTPPRYSKETFLTDLTRATGGQLYYFDAMGSLSGTFAAVAEELRHIYVIGYYPTNPLENGGFRRVRVTVLEPDAKVRAREGYTARSPQATAAGTPFTARPGMESLNR